jgi:hypothetical protein
VITFNSLEHAIFPVEPLRLAESAWIQHISFAMFFVDILRPRNNCEAGSLCRAVLLRFLPGGQGTEDETRCYAVDTR